MAAEHYKLFSTTKLHLLQTYIAPQRLGSQIALKLWQSKNYRLNFGENILKNIFVAEILKKFEPPGSCVQWQVI